MTRTRRSLRKILADEWPQLAKLYLWLLIAIPVFFAVLLSVAYFLLATTGSSLFTTLKLEDALNLPNLALLLLLTFAGVMIGRSAAVLSGEGDRYRRLHAETGDQLLRAGYFFTFSSIGGLSDRLINHTLKASQDPGFLERSLRGAASFAGALGFILFVIAWVYIIIAMWKYGHVMVMPRAQAHQ